MSHLPPETIATLTACLEQKKLFIVTILDITIQLQVKSKNKIVDFGDLLTKRQIAMDRITKCDALVNSTLAEFDDDTKLYFKTALKTGECIEHPTLGELAKVYNTNLAKFAECNEKLMVDFKLRYDGALKDVNQSRIKRKTMYK